MAQRSSEQLAAITIDAKNTQYSNSAQQFGGPQYGEDGVYFDFETGTPRRPPPRSGVHFQDRHLSATRGPTCRGALGRPSAARLQARRAQSLHDRLRFAATITGVVFSMVLVTVQMGLFVSFRTMVTTMIDHAPADLWIMPLGTRC